MPALRTTRFLLIVPLAAAVGCGAEPRVKNAPNAALATNPARDTADLAPTPKLPPPDPARIGYEPAGPHDTLRFYDLSGPSRWMVRLPGEKVAVPVGPEHKLPAEADPDRTLVYYARPGGKQSPAVSLRQIRDAHTP